LSKKENVEVGQNSQEGKKEMEKKKNVRSDIGKHIASGGKKKKSKAEKLRRARGRLIGEKKL